MWIKIMLLLIGKTTTSEQQANILSVKEKYWEKHQVIIKDQHVKVVCSLNLWRSLHLPLINCKIEFDLTSSKDCITYEISRTDAMVAKTPNLTGVAIETTGSIFQMNSAKLYVPVVTLSINENNF